MRRREDADKTVASRSLASPVYTQSAAVLHPKLSLSDVRANGDVRHHRMSALDDDVDVSYDDVRATVSARRSNGPRDDDDVGGAATGATGASFIVRRPHTTRLDTTKFRLNANDDRPHLNHNIKLIAVSGV